MRKILIEKISFLRRRAELDELAEEHRLEVIVAEAQTQSEFLSYFVNNDIDVIVNNWYDAHDFGGFSEDMIRTIAKSGVRLVVHEGAGYDVLGDIDVWKQMGVKVANCPKAPASDSADTALFLMLSALRNMNYYQTMVRENRWKGDDIKGMSPHNRNVGILGMGSIGRLIRDRVKGFPFESIYYHQRTKLDTEIEDGAKFVKDLDEFLSICDVVIVVVPHSKSTHHLLSRERLTNVIKQNSVIVNIARGPVIDEDAMVDALNSGRLFSVGLDVYEHEPNIHEGLLKSNRVTLLPHIGSHTEYCWDLFEQEVIANVRQFLTTGEPVTIVPEMRK